MLIRFFSSFLLQLSLISGVKYMNFNSLDKDIQEYIKSLEHQINVQNELIDAQKEIIDNLKLENKQHEKYAKQISEMISRLR